MATICADGATIMGTPFFNIMTLLPTLKPIVERIADASEHIAAGNKKDADYQASHFQQVLEHRGARRYMHGRCS